LAEELGIEPGPQLQHLQRAVLSADPALAPPAPQHSAPAQAPCLLPGDVTGFTGREQQLQQLDRLLTPAPSSTAAEIGIVSGTPEVSKTALVRPPLTWPRRIGTPPSEAECFQPRDQTAWLERTAAEGGREARCQVLAGLGGVGKTQLAAHHAYSLWQQGKLDLLIWITAATREAVIDAYRAAAEDLLGTEQDGPRAVEQLLAWLAATDKRWLIVLDDLAAPEHDPAGPAATTLMHGLWPPDTPRGRILVTTRLREAPLTGARRRRLDVDVFTAGQARAYLAATLAAHHRQEPTADLDALADALGRLPLALAQAAAYLIDAHLPAADYHRQLADHSRPLAALAPDLLPDEQTRTAAATWHLSLERADRHTAGLARPLLHLAAFLNPAGIPSAVLTAPAACAYLNACTASPQPPGRRLGLWLSRRRPSGSGQTPRRRKEADAGEVHRVLRILHRLSLADHNPGSPHQAVRVHQLIQRAIRDSLPPDQRDRAARAAAEALLDAWPATERDTALAQALRGNTAALIHHAEQVLYAPAAHPVLLRSARSLVESGQLQAATEHFRRLTEACWQKLGPDHPDTLTTRNDLAFWRGWAGDAAGAAAAYEKLLPDRLRVLGPRHRDTLATRHGLAFWRGKAGDVAGAVAALEELLPDMLRVLGPDHPETLATHASLAAWRGWAGEAESAAAALEELLSDRLRVLGPDHPETLATRHDIAFWRGEAGDAAGAVAALEGLPPDMLRVLGPEHPDTLTCRANLAFWRGWAGDAVGAAAALEELLSDRLRVLGPDHPDTFATRHGLAFWRGWAGDAAGAATALEELLPDMLRVLGPDHHGTLAAHANLAAWRGWAGDAAGAATALEELPPDMLRVLGPDHPDTLTCRHGLAYWWGEAARSFERGA
ncbi:tetratricopeptide repeat protein, partial [Streptomyces ruber]|uniref:tetratricopeptide repeat protein n=2 Tax=Streptomyces TaxID=1883 RepID=UPI0027E5359E